MIKPTAGNLSSAAEAVVVMLAANGDDAAFTELVRRRQSWLRGLLRRLARDPALADDLSQQAFILAWQKLKQLQQPEAFGGWLRSLAVNLWLQSLRARRDLSLDAMMNDTAELLPVTDCDPTQAMDLDRLLSRLKPAERVCIVLCHAEGMSHAEIARLTEWPMGTIKSHITRGLAQLRALMDGRA